MLLGRGCFSVASGPPELVLVVKEPMTFDRLDQLELSVTNSCGWINVAYSISLDVTGGGDAARPGW